MRGSLALLVLILTLAPVVASAQPARKPTAAEKAQAQRHYQNAKALQEAGQFDEAIAEYQAAYDLAGFPAFLFNIARAYQIQGNRAKAIEYYEKFLVLQPQGEGSDEAREFAAGLRRELELEAETAQRQAEAEEARRQAEEARRQAEDARRQADLEEARRQAAVAKRQAEEARLEAERAKAARQQAEASRAEAAPGAGGGAPGAKQRASSSRGRPDERHIFLSFVKLQPGMYSDGPSFGLPDSEAKYAIWDGGFHETMGGELSMSFVLNRYGALAVALGYSTLHLQTDAFGLEDRSVARGRTYSTGVGWRFIKPRPVLRVLRPSVAVMAGARKLKLTAEGALGGVLGSFGELVPFLDVEPTIAVELPAHLSLQLYYRFGLLALAADGPYFWGGGLGLGARF